MVEEDAVNHPNHYNQYPIECIEIAELMNFNKGNALKYIWRAGSKGDSTKEIEDLRKAAVYATREADRLEKLNVTRV